ncbi:MAG: sigma-70 family RNA polymerase sigma factor [Proteobacteria bacterium]|nr:sigma-70 family RNA polymerase sigma factor [Pseudomonadota bacterium]
MEPVSLPAASTVEDRAAHDARFAALYAELHRIARREAHRYGERGALGTTTLLHDAYLQIAQRDGLAFDTPAPFLAYAARAMRGLVIDRVRARSALRRGGDLTIASLDTETAEAIDDPQVLEHVSDALDELAAIDPFLARLVDLKFFCGLTMAEIAAQEHTSLRTVERQWGKARALLYRVLKAG